MGLDTACAVEVALVVALAVLIVAIVAASAGACAGAGAGAAVHDVELALGDATTLTTYEQARAAGDGKPAAAAAAAAEDEAPRCALCLSEYAGADELVRVVAACGHFFHAECGVDAWLRARGTCPLCRGEVWALPRPEGPPLPAR